MYATRSVDFSCFPRSILSKIIFLEPLDLKNDGASMNYSTSLPQTELALIVQPIQGILITRARTSGYGGSKKQTTSE